MTDPNIESYGDDAPEFFVADRPDEDEGPGMAPADVAFAILDGWANRRGFVEPTADDAAIAAAAACAYELRELRRFMERPPFVIAPDLTREQAANVAAELVKRFDDADGPRRVIKIGD